MSDEQVLVIPARVLEGLGSFHGFSAPAAGAVAQLLDPSHLEFRPRIEVETDPSVKQLIPYAVLHCGDRVFHYTRGSAGGEARLRAKRSVGIGGHISRADAVGGPGDWYRTGFERELAEEVAIDSPYAGRVIGLVYDPSTPVGEVHLGIVHELRLERPAVRALEPAITAVGFAPLDELVADRAAFETWSQLVMDAM